MVRTRIIKTKRIVKKEIHSKRTIKKKTKEKQKFKKESVIGSENVEEESDEEDQEARDQCKTDEVRSRHGETEEQTQVEDQVSHRQQGDGSQGTGDDANQEPCEPHSTRSERNTETGRSERVEDRENTSAARLWLRKWTRMAEGGVPRSIEFSSHASHVKSRLNLVWFSYVVRWVHSIGQVW